MKGAFEPVFTELDGYKRFYIDIYGNPPAVNTLLLWRQPRVNDRDDIISLSIMIPGRDDQQDNDLWN